MCHRPLKFNIFMTEILISHQTTYPQCSPSLLSKWHHHQPVIQAKHLEEPSIPPYLSLHSNPSASPVQSIFPLELLYTILLGQATTIFCCTDSSFIFTLHDYRVKLVLYTCLLVLFLLFYWPVYPARL